MNVFSENKRVSDVCDRNISYRSERLESVLAAGPGAGFIPHAQWGKRREIMTG